MIGFRNQRWITSRPPRPLLEAWMIGDVESLLRSLSGRGAGRLVLKTPGLSVAKRMPLDFWPGTSPGRLRLPGVELCVLELTAVWHAVPGRGISSISLFDESWELRAMLDFPGPLRSAAAITMRRIRCHHGRMTEGPATGTALGWDELWPTPCPASGGELPVGALARLTGRWIEVTASHPQIAIVTELKASTIDSDGAMVRLSDRPRTQVCYADLEQVVVLGRKGGRLKLRRDEPARGAATKGIGGRPALEAWTCG